MAKRIARGIKTANCIFLLALYIAGPWQLEMLHGLFHAHHHEVTHSESQENDLCHRAIYHSDKEGSCGHHAHVVVADKCQLCDLIFHTDQLFLPASGANTLFFYAAGPALSAPGFVGIYCTIDSSRAPPVV